MYHLVRVNWLSFMYMFIFEVQYFIIGLKMVQKWFYGTLCILTIWRMTTDQYFTHL